MKKYTFIKYMFFLLELFLKKEVALALCFQRTISKNLLILCCCSIFLASCSEDTSDLAKYINDIKSRPAKPIEPIPKFAPLPIFKFPEDDTRRSPFKPASLKKGTDNSAPDQKRPKQPLESFPLDALKFVGTLKEGSQIWALIKQPDSKISRVRVGDYMGQNYGLVVKIKDKEIKLEEKIKKLGTWQKKMTTINLDTGN